MGFFRSLERKVTRPLGRGLKAAAPVIGGIAGSFIPGVGNVVGSALGSAIGGQLKRGKFDAGGLLKDAGVGVLTGGVMSKLGGGGFLGGKGGMSADRFAQLGSEIDSAGALASSDVARSLATRGGSAAAAAAPAAAQAARSSMGANVGNFLKDGKNIKAIGDTLIGGYGAVQNERAMRMQQDEMRRRQQIEDEDRRRREALDPARGALLAALMQRMGMGGGAA